jgi:hypothetical protein
MSNKEQCLYIRYPDYRKIRHKTPTSSSFASYIRQLVSPL